MGDMQHRAVVDFRVLGQATSELLRILEGTVLAMPPIHMDFQVNLPRYLGGCQNAIQLHAPT